MKNTFSLLLLTSLLSIGCGSNTTFTPVTANDTTAILPAAPVENLPTQTSYIGKTTAELDAMGRYNCAGGSVGEFNTSKTLYITTYAANAAACENGENQFFIEQKLSNDANGKANMVVLDELFVTSRQPGQAHFFTSLNLNGGKKESYIVAYVEDGSKVVTQVGKLWLINQETKKFEEVSVPAGFSFPHPFNSDEDMD